MDVPYGEDVRGVIKFLQPARRRPRTPKRSNFSKRRVRFKRRRLLAGDACGRGLIPRLPRALPERRAVRVRDEETQTGEGFAVALGAPEEISGSGRLGLGRAYSESEPEYCASPRPRRDARGARRPDQLASTWLDLLIRGGTAESTPPGLGDCVRAPAGSDDSPLGLSGEGDAVREGVSEATGDAASEHDADAGDTSDASSTAASSTAGDDPSPRRLDALARV